MQIKINAAKLIVLYRLLSEISSCVKKKITPLLCDQPNAWLMLKSPAWRKGIWWRRCWWG